MTGGSRGSCGDLYMVARYCTGLRDTATVAVSNRLRLTNAREGFKRFLQDTRCATLFERAPVGAGPLA